MEIPDGIGAHEDKLGALRNACHYLVIIRISIARLKSKREENMEIPKEKLLEIYERMATIRQFEERVREEFAANRIPGFVHLYAGEEAVAVGVCAHLTDEDMITSTHRGHGHCIAKGVDVKAMMAELYGRATGACKGKGGSMHIADLDRGMLGANGIVGGGIPLACGAALSAQVLEKDNVAVSFFGDGGANEGSFHEGLNLAGVWQLPAIFVAENNGWAESTSSDYSVAGADIAGRARAYGMRGVVVDGLDLFDVYEKAGKAIAAARAGEGPHALGVQNVPLLRSPRRRQAGLQVAGGGRRISQESLRHQEFPRTHHRREGTIR